MKKNDNNAMYERHCADRSRRSMVALLLASTIAVQMACTLRELPPKPPLRNVSWEEIPIWHGAPPGDFPVRGPESRTVEDQGWRKITLLKNVATPMLTLIRPPQGRANGAAMVVLPGGAFGALAWDVEGTEVAQFLSDRGITAFVLKYRVRTPDAEMWQSIGSKGIVGAMESGRQAAAADAMQAVRYVRSRAADYGIDPERLGMIGFSAGAITTLRVLRDADAGARPNVVVSVYGLLLDEGVRPEFTPMFIAVAQDDVVEQSRAIDALWRKAGAPSEFHVFASGSHGFGMGRPDTESARFPILLEQWLRKRNYITKVEP